MIRTLPHLFALPTCLQKPLEMSRRFSMMLIFTSLLSGMTNLCAADLERGEALHDEHCTSCHKPVIYTRSDRMVNNLDALRERVKQCELANDLLWFEEDVEDVSAYLNSGFYQFGIK